MPYTAGQQTVANLKPQSHAHLSVLSLPKMRCPCTIFQVFDVGLVLTLDISAFLLCLTVGVSRGWLELAKLML